MEERFQYHPEQVKGMSTEQLRDAFAILNVMQPGKLQFVYTHYDRMIVGGITPTSGASSLTASDQLKSEYFLERREMGIINVGGSGEIVADGTTYLLDKLDCLYLGRGTKEVSFRSTQSDKTDQFFILSAPAHQ